MSQVGIKKSQIAYSKHGTVEARKGLKFQEKNSEMMLFKIQLFHTINNKCYLKSGLLSEREMCILKRGKKKESSCQLSIVDLPIARKKEHQGKELFLILSLFIHLPISSSLEYIIYKVYIKNKNRNIPQDKLCKIGFS